MNCGSLIHDPPFQSENRCPTQFLHLWSKAMEFAPVWHLIHSVLSHLQNFIKNPPLQTVPQQAISNSAFLLASTVYPPSPFVTFLLIAPVCVGVCVRAWGCCVCAYMFLGYVGCVCVHACMHAGLCVCEWPIFDPTFLHWHSCMYRDIWPWPPPLLWPKEQFAAPHAVISQLKVPRTSTCCTLTTQVCCTVYWPWCCDWITLYIIWTFNPDDNMYSASCFDARGLVLRYLSTCT